MFGMTYDHYKTPSSGKSASKASEAQRGYNHAAQHGPCSMEDSHELVGLGGGWCDSAGSGAGVRQCSVLPGVHRCLGARRRFRRGLSIGPHLIDEKSNIGRKVLQLSLQGLQASIAASCNRHDCGAQARGSDTNLQPCIGDSLLVVRSVELRSLGHRRFGELLKLSRTVRGFQRFVPNVTRRLPRATSDVDGGKVERFVGIPELT